MLTLTHTDHIYIVINSDTDSHWLMPTLTVIDTHTHTNINTDIQSD